MKLHLALTSAFFALMLQQTRALEVMGWVPPYSVAACQSAVTADFGTYDAKDGLTRVGLQFWVPRTDGTIKYPTHEWYVPSDSDVAWWRNWGQANGIKIMLTVYNNTGTWDWALATAAFNTNRSVFVNALVTEMDRLALDGIDIDFEGIGSLDGDRAAFAAFVTELSTQVKARGKILTIDSFHYIWNAPNQSWWADWVGKVNQVHSMGYDDLYEGGTSYHKYSFQQSAGVTAGLPASAVLLGVPSWVDSWGTSSGRGTTTMAHLGEIRLDLPQQTGIAIWDLALTAPSWRTSQVWGEVAAIKSIASAPNNVAPVVNDQSVTTGKDTPITIMLSGSDANGDPITYSVTSVPSHGSLTSITANSVNLHPCAQFCGQR
jgi:hypothetical protein